MLFSLTIESDFNSPHWSSHGNILIIGIEFQWIQKKNRQTKRITIQLIFTSKVSSWKKNERKRVSLDNQRSYFSERSSEREQIFNIFTRVWRWSTRSNRNQYRKTSPVTINSIFKEKKGISFAFQHEESRETNVVTTRKIRQDCVASRMSNEWRWHCPSTSLHLTSTEMRKRDFRIGHQRKCFNEI